MIQRLEQGIILLLPLLTAGLVYAEQDPRMTEPVLNSWPTPPQTREEAVEQLLNFDVDEQRRVRALAEANVMELAPVVVPYGEGLHGSNWFFGWPVAAGDGDVIVVVFQRSPYHYRGSNAYRDPDKFTSTAVMVRSEDGGQSWSDQVDLRQFATTKASVVPGGMRALKLLHDGRLVYIGDIGVLISDDLGKSWTHHPDAFQTARPEGLNSNIGPTIIEHPTLGLLLPAHAWRGEILDEMWFWQSQDGGISWHRTETPLRTPSRFVEPAGLHINGRLVLIGRSHDPATLEPDTRTFRYAQAVSKENSLELDTSFTNIRTSHLGEKLIGLVDERKSRAFGFWSQDTVDIILNPMTKRIEVVATNRTGRGGPHVDDISRQSLNLWSIDPADLLAGSSEWRFEGTLIERPTLEAPKFFDGMHPASSVVDEVKGVQHLVIYCGYYAGPSGVFRITRSLNTPLLQKHLHQVRRGQ